MAATTRTERLVARVTPEQKELIEHAAQLTGRTLTDFVLTAVQDAAGRAVREHEVLTLSARDSLIFAQALLNPPPPSEVLRRAAARANGRIAGLDE